MRKFLIKVNNNQYEVEVEEIRDNSISMTEDEMNCTKAEPVQKLPAKAPTQAPAAVSSGKESSAGGTDGKVKITAPMPGVILKVPVSIGASVKKGQVLLLLEAMKMENEIIAPADGVIASINVAEGNSISAGELLISLN